MTSCRTCRSGTLTPIPLLAILLMVPSLATPVRAQGDASAGERIYTRYCLSCHGRHGDGHGPAAARLPGPAPRDFTTGTYRLRTTPTGDLPAPEDLAWVVRNGVPGTSMPAWAGVLDEHETRDVVSYVQSFSPRFRAAAANEPNRRVHVAAHVPPVTGESLRRGRGVFLLMKCWTCHGAHGAGDGPQVPELMDDHRRHITPRDLTQGEFRWGGGPRNVYRTLATGLDGTPMVPVFADPMEMLRPLTILREAFLRETLQLEQLSSEDRALLQSFVATIPSGSQLAELTEEEERALLEGLRWDLVHYVRSLARGGLRRFLGLETDRPLYGGSNDTEGLEEAGE